MLTKSLHDFTETSIPSSAASVDTRSGTSKTIQMPPDEQLSKPQHSTTTVALETNELLHNILSELPIELRVRVRRVSKTWNLVISKLGYCIDPTASYHSEYYEFPRYSAHLNIRPNPIVSANFIHKRSDGAGYELSAPDRDRLRYYNNLWEFLTTLPIAQIACYYRYNSNTAVM